MKRAWHRLLESIPPGVRLVLAVLVAGALAAVIGARTGLYDLDRWLALSGPGFWSGHVWQIVTYILVPGSFLNFLLNLLVIAWLGRWLERVWSRRELWSYCVVVTVGAGAAKVILQFSLPTVLVGSAPLVFGFLAAWAFLFRCEKVALAGLGEVTVGWLAATAGALDFAMTWYSSGLANAIILLGGALTGLLYLALQARVIAAKPSRVVRSERVHRLEL